MPRTRYLNKKSLAETLAVFVDGLYQAKETWTDGRGRPFQPGPRITECAPALDYSA